MNPRRTHRPTWYHVGDMTRKEQRTSFEGTGLSISPNPNAWTRIAKLGGGTCYTVTKKHPTLLDIHALTRVERQTMLNWAVDAKYLERATIWRYREGVDDDETVTFEFTSHEDWLDHIGCEPGEEERNNLRLVGGYIGTPALFKAEGWHGDNPPALAETFAILRYVDEVLEWDGVYWRDRLDVTRLSAPRAVLFQSRLPEWHIAPTPPGEHPRK